MITAAKFAAPHATSAEFVLPGFDRAGVAGVTLFNAPPGYLHTESLYALLRNHHSRVVWLRLGPEDHDPASLLLSLIEAARQARPESCQVTLERMQVAPGPVSGWPPLFSCLAQDYLDALPFDTAIVVENLHHLDGSLPTLKLFGNYLLPELSRRFKLVLTTQSRLPVAALPKQVAVKSSSDLRVDRRTGALIARKISAGLSEDVIQRALNLTGGSPVTIEGVIHSVQTLGPEFIRHAVERSRTSFDLLQAVSRGFLVTAETTRLHALTFSLILTYSHPRIEEAVLGSPAPLDGPWVQPLSGDWVRMRQVWQSPLRAVLHLAVESSYATLHRAADYLANQRDEESAVRLYLELKDYASAARVITSASERLLGFGQWETLREWLGSLPESTREDWPELVYAGGELEAAAGEFTQARRSFSRAASLYATASKVEEASQSLLAESALAAWQDDLERARASALAACTLAKSSGLGWQQGWAAWQLGCLAFSAGNLEEAHRYFNQAATVLAAPHFDETLRQASELTLRQLELENLREYHRKAYLKAEQEEQALINHLDVLIHAPPAPLDEWVGSYGWLRTPFFVKLTPPMTEIQPPANHQPAGWLQGLLVALRSSRMMARLAGQPPVSPFDASRERLGSSISIPASSPLSSEQPVRLSDSLPVSYPAGAGPELQPQPVKAAALAFETPATLSIYCLGVFRILLHGDPVDEWASRKALSIVKYLAAHQGAPVPKEILMDTFWPEADPEAARRNLHQAIYALRQTLKRDQADVHYVLFENDCYRLNPAAGLWIDHIQFEALYRKGQSLESERKPEPAADAYRAAETLYQDHFLADDLYEDWMQPRRQYLWEAYLTISQRLSQWHLEKKDYTQVILLNQRVLARDRCQEHAHQNLMRCFAAGGQRQLAVQQYRLLVQALKEDLDLTPSPETEALYRELVANPG